MCIQVKMLRKLNLLLEKETTAADWEIAPASLNGSKMKTPLRYNLENIVFQPTPATISFNATLLYNSKQVDITRYNSDFRTLTELGHVCKDCLFLKGEIITGCPDVEVYSVPGRLDSFQLN